MAARKRAAAEPAKVVPPAAGLTVIHVRTTDSDWHVLPRRAGTDPHAAAVCGARGPWLQMAAGPVAADVAVCADCAP